MQLYYAICKIGAPFGNYSFAIVLLSTIGKKAEILGLLDEGACKEYMKIVQPSVSSVLNVQVQVYVYSFKRNSLYLARRKGLKMTKFLYLF